MICDHLAFPTLRSLGHVGRDAEEITTPSNLRTLSSNAILPQLQDGGRLKAANSRLMVEQSGIAHPRRGRKAKQSYSPVAA